MWRRNKRLEWGLSRNDGDRSTYPTVQSYAQPHREDWPVYDPDANAYVEHTEITAHLESMLELNETDCAALRCVSIFHRVRRERGKSGKAPTFNLKKMSITRGRWETELAETRCASDRAKAAYRWLYSNNMT